MGIKSSSVTTAFTSSALHFAAGEIFNGFMTQNFAHQTALPSSGSIVGEAVVFPLSALLFAGSSPSAPPDATDRGRQRNLALQSSSDADSLRLRFGIGGHGYAWM